MEALITKTAAAARYDQQRTGSAAEATAEEERDDGNPGQSNTDHTDFAFRIQVHPSSDEEIEESSEKGQ